MKHPIGIRVAAIVWPTAVAYQVFGSSVSIIVAVVLLAAIIAWEGLHT